METTATKRRREYLKDKKCEWCGSTEKLVLHHRDPKAKITHQFWGRNEELRKSELAKCIVLCQKCHMMHHVTTRAHNARKTNTPKGMFARNTHGTLSCYRHNKCRCELCKAAKREYDKTHPRRLRNNSLREGNGRKYLDLTLRQIQNFPEDWKEHPEDYIYIFHKNGVIERIPIKK